MLVPCVSLCVQQSAHVLGQRFSTFFNFWHCLKLYISHIPQPWIVFIELKDTDICTGWKFRLLLGTTWGSSPFMSESPSHQRQPFLHLRSSYHIKDPCPSHWSTPITSESLHHTSHHKTSPHHIRTPPTKSPSFTESYLQIFTTAVVSWQISSECPPWTKVICFHGTGWQNQNKEWQSAPPHTYHGNEWCTVSLVAGHCEVMVI